MDNWSELPMKDLNVENWDQPINFEIENPLRYFRSWRNSEERVHILEKRVERLEWIYKIMILAHLFMIITYIKLQEKYF